MSNDEIDEAPVENDVQQMAPHELTPSGWGPPYNPPISEADRKQLRDDIAAYGRVLAPLILWEHGGDKLVVGGNNRLEIALELGLSVVPVVIREYENEEAAKIAAIKDNQTRRNATDAQKAEWALALQKIISVGRGARTDLSRLSSKLKKVDSHAEAAKAFGTSIASMSAMKKILACGDEKLVNEVRLGMRSIHNGKKMALALKSQSSKPVKERTGKGDTSVTVALKLLKNVTAIPCAGSKTDSYAGDVRKKMALLTCAIASESTGELWPDFGSRNDKADCRYVFARLFFGSQSFSVKDFQKKVKDACSSSKDEITAYVNANVAVKLPDSNYAFKGPFPNISAEKGNELLRELQ